ncbi:hypothetical protein TNCV_1172051 [Trichonephila clavipes]|uniref:Uncharacterized protein n=1 Tax=Trichonephila clavipes TaxID=2585209 RepID=A0A8X6VEM0_TRICX|nr:hypothetical protein TNCV_1172051 [Trichonephila clavipes]
MRANDFRNQKIYRLPGSNPQRWAYEESTLPLSHRSECANFDDLVLCIIISSANLSTYSISISRWLSMYLMKKRRRLLQRLKLGNYINIVQPTYYVKATRTKCHEKALGCPKQNKISQES